MGHSEETYEVATQLIKELVANGHLPSAANEESYLDLWDIVLNHINRDDLQATIGLQKSKLMDQYRKK